MSHNAHFITVFLDLSSCMHHAWAHQKVHQNKQVMGASTHSNESVVMEECGVYLTASTPITFQVTVPPSAPEKFLRSANSENGRRKDANKALGVDISQPHEILCHQ